MTGIPEFPNCLQRSDLGGATLVRTSKTEEAYRTRYAGMAKTLARKHDEPVSVIDVIEDLRRRAPSLKRNSYYLFRAAILQELRDWFQEGFLSDEKAQQLVGRLTPEGQIKSVGTLAPTGRTSADRRCHVRPETLAALAVKARDHNHPTFNNLADLLEFGIKVGTRPCELIGARLEGRKLSIVSAKVSSANGRGLAEVRDIGLLEDFDDFDLDGLRRLLTRLADELATVRGDRTRLVRRYGDALRRLRRGLPWAARVTLKTTRSQCRATLARGRYSPTEIASLFGHASAETAASNYGRVNKGWHPIQGGVPLAISSNMLARVRPGARTKAKLARNQPLTLTEVRVAHGHSKMDL